MIFISFSVIHKYFMNLERVCQIIARTVETAVEDINTIEVNKHEDYPRKKGSFIPGAPFFLKSQRGVWSLRGLSLNRWTRILSKSMP